MNADDDARGKVLNWLKHSEHSASSIRQRLVAAGCQPEESALLVEHLVADGTIDDARCAESLVNRWMQSGPIAPAELRRRLEDKGISDAIAEPVIDAACDDDAMTLAMQAAERKLKSLGRLEPEVAARRLFGHLARRGYDEDTARSVLDRLGLLPAHE